MAEDSPDLRLIAAQEELQKLLASSSLCAPMAEPLRPQHFLTRQNGTMVPLVALDELPATVTLRGVPRTLSPYDVAGMTGLGTVESQHRQYVIDGLKHGFHPDHKVAENGLLASKYANTRPKFDLESALSRLELPPRAPSTSTLGPLPKAYGIEEARPALPNLLRKESPLSTEPATRPLTIDDLARNPAPGVKEYCSYWLRHGECDYAQQGCLYRHEMPLDPPTLEKLGLRDIPRWYREKHGLGSYLALTAQRATSGSTRSNPMDRNWRDSPADANPESAKTSVTSSYLGNGHTRTNPSNHSTGRGTVGAWNAFAKTHSAACHSPTRGPLRSPPPSPARQPLPFPNPPPNSAKATRPGTRLVPANTETVSARVLREANEQLDAHEERERAALQKYAPLVPHRTGPATGSSTDTETGSGAGNETANRAADVGMESALITPPPSDQDSSRVELSSSDTSTASAQTSKSNSKSTATSSAGKGREMASRSPSMARSPVTAAAAGTAAG